MSGPANGKALGPDFIAASLPEPAGEAEVPMPVAEVAVLAPVFEVIIPSALAGVTQPAYHFKVWGDGRVEGFESLAATRRVVVVNRIPALLDQIAHPLREFVEDVEAHIAALAQNGVTQDDMTYYQRPCGECGYSAGHAVDCPMQA